MKSKLRQKFQRGDLVRIIGKDPFSRDSPRAIILGSYRDQYGGGKQEEKTFSVQLEKYGHWSWVDEKEMTIIKRRCYKLLQDWLDEERIEENKTCPQCGFVNRIQNYKTCTKCGDKNDYERDDD